MRGQGMSPSLWIGVCTSRVGLSLEENNIQTNQSSLGWVESGFGIFTTQPEPTQPEHFQVGLGWVVGLFYLKKKLCFIYNQKKEKKGQHPPYLIPNPFLHSIFSVSL